MEIGEHSKLDLEKRELFCVEKVRQAYVNFGHRLKNAYDAQDHEDLSRIAQNVGYEVKFVPIGFKFKNARNQIDEIGPENSARIGLGNKLYVGVNNNKIDYDDFVHDVGACILGGKLAKNGEVPRIRVETFNKITLNSIGKTFTKEELDRVGLIDLQREEYQNSIPKTWLLDALVFGVLPYRAIKYIPGLKT